MGDRYGKPRWRSKKCPACGCWGDMTDSHAADEAGEDGPYGVYVCMNPDCRVDIYHGKPA